MEFLGVRSKKDFSMIQAINPNCHYSSDLAYSYAITNFKEDNQKKSIGIIVAGVGYLGRNIYNLDKVMENIQVFFNKDVVIKLYVFQSILQEDLLISNLIKSKIENYNFKCELFIHEDVDKTIQSLSKNSFIISDRLHGAIISHKLNIPFLMSTHHEKCKDFLDDIGCSVVEGCLSSISPYSFENAIKYSSERGKEESAKMTELSLNSLTIWNKFLST